ncbi:MAG TPA: hypothetical protein VMP86_07660 [Candidatus Binatia bacterium]|nr:hypothetical protein [Candidatus Binatia bacterium]
MIMPNPGVLDDLIRERQAHLHAGPRHARPGLRIRVGHALIVAGSALSGERVELPARHSSLHFPA